MHIFRVQTGMADLSPLFEPLTVRGVTLKNRVVMSPMTRFYSPGGIPTADVAAYYARRAAGGAGLIITEGVAINDPAAVDDANIPVMHGDAARAAWRNVVDRVHNAGGIIFPQLWHMGPMLRRGVGPHPQAEPRRPSGVWGPIGSHVVWGLDPEQLRLAQVACTEMSRDDIRQVLDAYAEAARMAKEVGFDGIAIHGAHGYLPDAFLWSATNLRQDEYGGDIHGRTLFVRELVASVRAAIGGELPVMLRYSQWKQQDYKAKIADTPDELEKILLPISAAGVDIFDASTRRYFEAEFAGSSLNLAGWTQRITGKPTMTVGSIGLNKDLYQGFQEGDVGLVDLKPVIDRFNQGEFSLVGVGRAMLSNPDFALRIRRNEKLRPYEEKFVMQLI
jgi:2,4-dienoyl-CoA reductase-like NADH-dependent reductase (Old Yellow Enzyme family)